MPKSPPEPSNLVLEQLRLMREDAKAMRAETSARFDKIDARFERIEADISDIKKDIRGLGLNAFAEIYKANLTVARLAGLDQRIEALEKKSSP
jgi:4-aminobutyrate aminotransferase-like enzyme